MGPRIARSVMGLCIAALVSGPALAQTKAWRHGLIEPKSDAGILYAASKRDFAEKLGLKLEFVPLKTDTIGLKAALAGQLASFEGGPGGTLVAGAGAEGVLNFVRVCLHAAGKTLSTRRDDAAKFLAAEMEGLRYAMSHRDETIKLTHEISGQKPDDPRAAFVFDDAVKKKAVAADLPIPMDKLDYIQKTLVSVGSMRAAIDRAKTVDAGVREKAHAGIDRLGEIDRGPHAADAHQCFLDVVELVHRDRQVRRDRLLLHRVVEHEGGARIVGLLAGDLVGELDGLVAMAYRVAQAFHLGGKELGRVVAPRRQRLAGGVQADAHEIGHRLGARHQFLDAVPGGDRNVFVSHDPCLHDAVRP